MMMRNINGSHQCINGSHVQQVVHAIKNSGDYSKAAKLMRENKLTMQNISEQTIKLTQRDFAKLADCIIESK